ncbi:MAG: OmpH/Skp family outer membrane protein [Planctomycetota bacterium]|jgi:Skp family chaperone for outer membrane proteins
MKAPILSVFFSALVLATLAPGLRAEEEKPATRILVMDVQRIIDESDEGKQFVVRVRQQIAEKKREILAERQKLQQELKSILEAKLSDRNEAWYERFREAARQEVNLKAEEMLFERKVGDQLGRAITQIVRGAQQEARAIMKQRGADVVIASKMGPVTIESDQEFQQEIVSRRVVCAKKDIDITDEVIQRMNAWYREHKPKKSPPPAREDIQPARKDRDKDDKDKE